LEIIGNVCIFTNYFDSQEMPTVLRIGSYRFHFYSDEYNEPPHIHVEATDGECKFWLNPVKLAGNRNLTPKIVRNNRKVSF
jgi:hypothetical protein